MQHELLEGLKDRTLQDMLKRVERCEDREILLEMINHIASIQQRKGAGDWRYGHMNRHDLDTLSITADRRCSTLDALRLRQVEELERPLYIPHRSDPLPESETTKETFAYEQQKPNPSSNRGQRTTARIIE